MVKIWNTRAIVSLFSILSSIICFRWLNHDELWSTIILHFENAYQHTIFVDHFSICKQGKLRMRSCEENVWRHVLIDFMHNFDFNWVIDDKNHLISIEKMQILHLILLISCRRWELHDERRWKHMTWHIGRAKMRNLCLILIGRERVRTCDPFLLVKIRCVMFSF